MVVPMYIPHAWLFGYWFQALEAFVFSFLKTRQGAALLTTTLASMNAGANFACVRVANQIHGHFYPTAQEDNAVDSARNKENKKELLQLTY